MGLGTSVILYHDKKYYDDIYANFFRQRANAVNFLIDENKYSEARQIALEVNNTTYKVDMQKLAEKIQEELAGTLGGADLDKNLSILYAEFDKRATWGRWATKEWREATQALEAIKQGYLNGANIPLSVINQYGLNNLTRYKAIADLKEKKLETAIGVLGESTSAISAAATLKALKDYLQEEFKNKNLGTVDIINATYTNTGSSKLRSKNFPEINPETRKHENKMTSRQVDNELEITLEVNGETTTLNLGFSDKAKKDFAKGFYKWNNKEKGFRFHTIKKRSAGIVSLLNKYSIGVWSESYSNAINTLSLHIYGDRREAHEGARSELKNFLGRALFNEMLDYDKIDAQGKNIEDKVHFTVVGNRLVLEENIYADILKNNKEKLKATIEGISTNHIMKERLGWASTSMAEAYFKGVKVRFDYTLSDNI